MATLCRQLRSGPLEIQHVISSWRRNHIRHQEQRLQEVLTNLEDSTFQRPKTRSTHSTFRRNPEFLAKIQRPVFLLRLAQAAISTTAKNESTFGLTFVPLKVIMYMDVYVLHRLAHAKNAFKPVVSVEQYIPRATQIKEPVKS